MLLPSASITRPSPTGTSRTLARRTRAMDGSPIPPLGERRHVETGTLPLAQQPRFSDADLEMIPRQKFRRLTHATRVKCHVAVPLPHPAALITICVRRQLDEIRDTPVAASQQGLKPGLTRILVHHAHRERSC